MTLEEYQDMEIDKLFFRLGNSKFRSRFHLTDKDKKYVLEKGMDVVSSHAYDFISTSFNLLVFLEHSLYSFTSLGWKVLMRQALIKL